MKRSPYAVTAMAALTLLLGGVGSAIAAPANDQCADATAIAGLPFQETTSTVGQTRDPADPQACSTNTGSNVWYAYTPHHDATLCVRTAWTDYSIVSYPLVDSCTGHPVNNYYFCGPQNDYTFTTAANVPLFIQVASTDQRGGQLVFTLANAANDTDRDGVKDCDDDCVFVPDPEQKDSDYDGIGDACDPCVGNGPDLDGDGLCGQWDNCATVANPDQADADSDAVGDVCDACAGYGGVDADGDGVCDDAFDSDNCPTVANPDQADADGDYIGDACDPCFGDGDDPDGDGICGEDDNCPQAANPGQEDSDGDGFGDACDACPGYGTVDTDGDGVCDEVDRCDTVPDPEQLDHDGDGLGDACDPCPAMPLPNAVEDSDGDGRPDLCDACRDDPTDSCVSALACSLDGALLRVGKDGGSFVGWTDLPGCKGLAADPATGKLFTLVFDGDLGTHVLATIDPTTGAGTKGPPVGGFTVYATLAFSPDGVLYGLDNRSGVLRTIDTTTGAATIVGTTVTNRDGHGLTFDPGGQLTLAGDNNLFSVDPVSAAAQAGAGLVFTPFCSFDQSIWALTVDAGGTLLGILRCDFWSYLVTIDRTSGAIQIVSQNLPLTGGVAVTPELTTAEHCGNCVDDDGDGLVDFDDPDCCGAGTSALDPARALLAGRADGTSAVTFTGRLAAGSLPPVGSQLRDVYVQLHDEQSGATFCAMLPADGFHRHDPRLDLTFADARRAMSSALGIQQLKLRERREDVRFALRGRQVPLFPLAPGPLRMTLAFHVPSTRFSTTECHSASVATRPRGASAVRYP
jgi:Thrombospondin type 3 repeat